MELHLVADTNLFFEFRALEGLPWDDLGYDLIVILLTKPVLDEIDKHKKANGRTRKRALDIFQRVRGMLTTSKNELIIREASPKVILRRIPNVTPDEAHSGVLDYTKNDDRLIGILATLNQKASDHKVMLFTDDTGPASTADGLGLPFAMINEAWRRPAEESTESKRIRELEKDLATYRSQEPKISIIRCIPADDAGVVTVRRRIAQPLTETEIDEILDALRLKHPVKMDFTRPPDPDPAEAGSPAAFSIQFNPPSDADIHNYQNALYPQWIDNCRAILSELHVGRDEIEVPIILRWSMSNDGTRPASQVRVQFEAQGPLAIRRLSEKDDEADEEDADVGEVASAGRTVPKFPQPPKPPAFKKVVTKVPTPPSHTRAQPLDVSALRLPGIDPLSGVSNHLDLISEASRLLGQHRGIFDQLGVASSAFEQHRKLLGTSGMDALLRGPTVGQVSHHIEPLHLPRLFIPPKHDPEAFYYDWSATSPVKKGVLTCDLWRHQDSEEVFAFEVIFTNEGETRGSILCSVHAENLTKPETARISVIRTIDVFRPLDLARTMVETCG